ncbi:MAG TPA: RNA pseudouridine synthase [Spirochaetota bacterium]|nr:RNA pseudouridine synthase [Spirochaetota bacterium]
MFSPSALLQEGHDDFLVVNKPPGLAVHSGKNIKNSLIEILKTQFGNNLQLIHRLDRPVSGLLIVARSAKKNRQLSQALNKGCKQYIMICKGRFSKPKRVIKNPLKIKNKILPAETAVAVRKSFASFSLVTATLKTGRMHQIRRHMAAAEHPLLGDDKYGDFAFNKKYRRPAGKALFLHSWKLGFTYMSRAYSFCVPPPPYFSNFLRVYNINFTF